MAAARGRSLDALSMHPEPGAVFDSMWPRGEVVGGPPSGPFVDRGTPEPSNRTGGLDADGCRAQLLTSI